MPRRELDALLGHQVHERFVFRGQMFMNGRNHFFVALRAGDLEHLGMPIENLLRLGAQAPRHDHLAVLGQRFAYRIQRLIHRGIDESTGIDHDEVGGAIARGDLVPFGAQAGEDAFGIDQCFGAAQADKAHFRAFAFDGFHGMADRWQVSGRNCTPKRHFPADNRASGPLQA